MDNTSIFSSISFQIAAFITIFCCLFTFFAARSPIPAIIFRKVRSRRSDGVRVLSKKKKSCDCICSCSSSRETATSTCVITPYSNGSIGEKRENMPVRVSERQSGASMMEQLVPEITTHALSYLDYPSLCRLSMTNSSMRRAANDDSAWKALYHKDFSVEQDSVMPVNGWKAYYATTRAVVNINAEFYNLIRDRSLLGMGRLWLNADYVKCIHASGELFSGYDAVMDSWQLAFNWGQGVAFQIRDVRARVLTGMAWVTMKTYVDVLETGPFNVTNVYEFHKGQWYLVHHHSSVILLDAEVEHQNIFG